MAGAPPRLRPGDRERLVGAMGEVQGAHGGRGAAVVIRRHRPGDNGPSLPARPVSMPPNMAGTTRFEALAAEIGAAFLRKNDPARERAFIADRGGEVVGSVFCVDAGEGVAKLRMLYVEPRSAARVWENGWCASASPSPARPAIAA